MLHLRTIKYCSSSDLLFPHHSTTAISLSEPDTSIPATPPLADIMLNCSAATMAADALSISTSLELVAAAVPDSEDF